MRRAEASPTNAKETNEKNPLVKKSTGQLYLFFSRPLVSGGEGWVGGVDKLRVSRAFGSSGWAWAGMGWDGMWCVCGVSVVCVGVSGWAWWWWWCALGMSSGRGGGGALRELLVLLGTFLGESVLLLCSPAEAGTGADRPFIYSNARVKKKKRDGLQCRFRRA